VWLTASDQQRGLRRATEQTEDAVVAARLADDTAAALARRDNLDASRATSPARSAPGAVVIDTTAMTVDAVVDEVLELWLRAESPLRLGESASTSSDPHGVLR
jgi:cytidylate kinase